MNETQEKGKSYVESLRLADELEKRVALASVRIGDVLIHGVTVWQSGRGRIRVYFPSWKAGYRWEEAIELPNELRAEIETDVISRYKSEKQKAKKAEKERNGGQDE